MVQGSFSESSTAKEAGPAAQRPLCQTGHRCRGFCGGIAAFVADFALDCALYLYRFTGAGSI
jgi:hypothetical protein